MTQHLAALRFFYIKTQRKPWSIAQTQYPKKVQRLPIILSPEEVTQLIDSALTPFHRILLMTLYATGVRRADLRNIQILLGHRDLEETTIYLHLSQRHLNATASPLDSLKLKDKVSQSE